MKKRTVIPGESSSVRPFIPGLLLVAAVLIVYWPSINYDFINLDDPDFVSSNPHVLNGLSWEGVNWAFQPAHNDYWHPVTWLSLMLDISLFGPRAAGLHLTNVLLHAATALLVFLWLRRLTGSIWRSVVAAGLFALHPLRVESVAWITERKDVLSGFFAQLALCAYGHYVESKSKNSKSRTTRWYLITLGFFVLGLMSKAMVLTLPFVLLLLDYWPLRRISGRTINSIDGPARLPRTPVAVPFRSLLVEKIPFIALSAMSGALTLWGQLRDASLPTPADLSFALRIENVFMAYAGYLSKTFWPVNLAVWYPHPGHWPGASVLGAAAVIGTVSIAAVFLARTRPYAFVGWFWFVGTLVPVIGLTKGWLQYLADRFTYFPAIGLFIALVWTLEEITRPWRNRNALRIIAVAALLACAIRTRDQLGHWDNSENLFRHAVAVTSNNWYAHSNLALALRRNHKTEEALQHYQIALNLMPNDADTHNNFGVLLMGIGQIEPAAAQFEAAVRINPNNSNSHNNLGAAYYKLGQLDNAIAQFQKALELKPDSGSARTNLATMLEEKAASTATPPPSAPH